MSILGLPEVKKAIVEHFTAAARAIGHNAAEVQLDTYYSDQMTGPTRDHANQNAAVWYANENQKLFDEARQVEQEPGYVGLVEKMQWASVEGQAAAIEKNKK